MRKRPRRKHMNFEDELSKSNLKVFAKLFSKSLWGCSSAGRAPALQAGGQEFDPPHLHHVSLQKKRKQREGF